MNRVQKVEAFNVVAEPGDGTRYELTLVRRHGGGWFVLWPNTGLLAKVYRHHLGELVVERTSGGRKRKAEHVYDIAMISRILRGRFEFDQRGDLVAREVAGV